MELSEEPKCERMMERLVCHFFVNRKGGMEWSYREGMSVKDQDPELDAYMQQFIIKNNDNT